MLREKELKATSGLFVLLTGLAVLVLSIFGFVRAAEGENPGLAVISGVVLFLTIMAMAGLFTVNPNDAKVLTLFGRYMGTVREAGLWFANPFYAKKRISLRVRNFETAKLKVNDNHGNPIEIAAVVVWRVVDSAEALFEVDDYQHYVQTQSESAVRALAQTFPYDAHKADEIALSTHPLEVAKGLQASNLARSHGEEEVEAGVNLHAATLPWVCQSQVTSTRPP